MCACIILRSAFKMQVESSPCGEEELGREEARLVCVAVRGDGSRAELWEPAALAVTVPPELLLLQGDGDSETVELLLLRGDGLDAHVHVEAGAITILPVVNRAKRQFASVAWRRGVRLEPPNKLDARKVQLVSPLVSPAPRRGAAASKAVRARARVCVCERERERELSFGVWWEQRC
jgi:hypothetical protein